MSESRDILAHKRKRHGGDLSRKEKKKQKKSEADAATPLSQAEVNASTPAAKLGKKSRHDAGPDTEGNDKTLVAKLEGGSIASNSTLSRLGKGKGKKRRDKRPESWSVSMPIGGYFLPQDPVFSPDEKYLFIANTRAVQVYSTETSLPMRTLAVKSGYLLSYALSSTNSEHLYVSDSSGIITLWNWSDGKKAARWEIKTNIRQMAVVARSDPKQDLVFCHEVENSHKINVHALRTREQASQTELKQILKTKSAITGFQVLLDGNIVVVACQNSVMVGTRSKTHKTALQDFEYVWREFRTPKRITAFAAYAPSTSISGTGKNHSQDQRDDLNLAFGDENGAILVFEDMLSAFARLEKAKKDSGKMTADLDTLRPKRLHWHRDAVGSLKWSKDGNYVISGGKETVLIIWQLSTGKHQNLPHLTADIENIVVSPSGSSYSVSLANNSVVVLSTSELVAKTNIVGIQSRRITLEQMPRDSSYDNYLFDIFSQVPMAVDPKHNTQVVIAVPSSQPRQEYMRISPPQPYLQTFDIATDLHVSRQALTRNNATDLNTGPDKTRILEPNVLLLQISHDGKWLATVDEWTPPRSDTGYLEEGIEEFNEEERLFRREIYLKFWSWDATNTQWMLESRIDAPHSFDTLGASARVFDLVAEPTQVGFATVGEDRSVRIWRPKMRLRNGVTVRKSGKQDGEDLVTWSLDRSIDLCSRLDILDSSPNPNSSLNPRNSRLSFSADGSLLAAAVSWPSEGDPGVIYLLDVELGTVRRSITELDVTALSCIGLLGRYLVAVGDSIMVWDVVVDELVICVPLELPGIDRLSRPSLVRLAVNEKDGTFAVACPQFEKNDATSSRSNRYYKKATTKLFIFDPQEARVIWSSTVSDTVLGLRPAPGGSGYLILDSTASLRIVSPNAAVLQLPTPPPELAPRLTTNTMAEHEAEDVEGSYGITAEEPDMPPLSENDKPVVTPQQLQDIFEVESSYALPPVQDLFNAVVGLYARKAKTQ